MVTMGGSSVLKARERSDLEIRTFMHCRPPRIPTPFVIARGLQ